MRVFCGFARIRYCQINSSKRKERVCIGANDISLVRYFENSGRYADLMNGFIFQGSQVVSADDVKELDSRVTDAVGERKSAKEFTQRYRDMVRKTVFGMNFVTVAVENQDKIHYWMPVRVMSGDIKQYYCNILWKKTLGWTEGFIRYAGFNRYTGGNEEAGQSLSDSYF